MMYCKFNSVTGEAYSFCNEPQDETYLECIMPLPRSSEAQTILWQEVSGQLIGSWVGSSDPLDAPANNDAIKARHLELESAPIEVYGILMDADLLSEKRMTDCIETLDYLPLKPGCVEEIDGVKVRYWKDADNNWHPVSKATLILILAELIKLRGIRASILFDEMQEFKSNGCTQRDLIEWK